MSSNNTAARARAQAGAYDSVFAPTLFDLGNGETLEIPPHPSFSMLDDEKQQAYEELQFEIESCDRAPDVYVPEMELDSGVVLPAETKRGALLIPYRKNGELVTPPYSVRLVKTALGEQDWAKLKAAGKNAADVIKIWHEQSLRIAERQASDPFRNGSPSPLASVSRANR